MPQIIDLNIDQYSDEAFIQSVKRYDPLVVGISFMTNQYGEALNLARLVKKSVPGTYVAAGGPHVSALPKEIISECSAIDFAIVGEGEETFLELLFEIRSGRKSFDRIDGLCFRNEDNIIQTKPRSLVEDVDAIPFPAWDLLKVEKYSVFSINGENTFALLSSRGCPNRCIFCDSHLIFGNKFRGRSAQNIFAEIEFLNRQHGMVQFDFIDDMITLNRRRVLELCKLIKASGISFKWMANARVNTIDEEMLIAMKDSGCIRIDVGVESGDPSVRKIAQKGITSEQIITAHRLAKKVGIQIGTFAMVGNLGESMESVNMTAKLLKDIGEDVMISIACPFPGTELYRIAKEKDYLRVTDWSRYVTSPTYLDDYEPVMVTDRMNQDEIMKAYFYLHSFFAKRKFKTRYGKHFLINPLFIKEWVFNSVNRGGFFSKAAMFFRLVKARLAG